MTHAGGSGCLLHRGLAAEHDRRRAVGRRARLEVVQRIPQHRGLLDLLDRDVVEMQVRVRVLERVLAVLDRHLPPDVLGRARALDVVADPRGERAARTLPAGPPARERPRGVALGLLLVADDQHPFVATGLDQGGARDGGRRADRAGGVHTVDRLAHRTEASPSDSSGIITPSSASGALPMHDGVDVGERELRVVERPQRGLADQAVERDVGTATLVLRSDRYR